LTHDLTVKCFSEGTIAENLTETVPNWPWSDSIIQPPADTYLPPIFTDKLKVRTEEGHEKEIALKDEPNQIEDITKVMEIAGTTKNLVAMEYKVLNEEKNEMSNKEKTAEGHIDTKENMTNLLAKEKPKIENLDSKPKESASSKEVSMDSDKVFEETLKPETEKNEMPKKEKITGENLDVKSEKNEMLEKEKLALENLESKLKEETNPIKNSDKPEEENLDSDDVSEENLDSDDVSEENMKPTVEKNEMPKTEETTKVTLGVEEVKSNMFEKGKQKLESLMTITAIPKEESLDSDEALEAKIKLNKEKVDMFKNPKPILDSSGSRSTEEPNLMTNNNKSEEKSLDTGNSKKDINNELPNKENIDQNIKVNDTQISNSSDSKLKQDTNSEEEKNKMKLSLQTLKSNLNEAINKIINNDKLKEEKLDTKEDKNEMLNTGIIKEKTDKIAEVLEGEEFEMMMKQKNNVTHLKEEGIKNNNSDRVIIESLKLKAEKNELLEKEKPEEEKLDLKSDKEKFESNSKLDEHNKVSSGLFELSDNSKAEIRPSETDLTLTNTRELLFEATTSAMQEVRKKQFNFTVTLPVNQSISNLIVTFKDDNDMTESRKARCHLMPKVVLSTAPSISRMSRSFACFEV
jgi:hypothetical protein